MDSTVKVCLFSILISFASAAIDDNCKFVGEFCDPEKSTADPFTLSGDATDMAKAINECYDECLIQKTAAIPCLGFTVRQTSIRPPTCYLLRSPCVLNSVDECLNTSPDASCASGPTDCNDLPPPAVCSKAVPVTGDSAIWQCQDYNTDPINPYTEDPPVGTVCYQTCSSWRNADGDELPGQLVSTCEAGGWSPTESADLDGGELFDPAFPLSGAYPTPDAAADTALPCGCQPLHVQWLYGAADGFYYDPNAEEAAEFICERTVDMTDKEYIIETDNTCVLYCDDHYVATATCLDGEWSGRPDWGFWCYEVPIAIA